MSATSLIYDLNDPRISRAAQGIRPTIGDHDPLPERFYKFAPSGASYSVNRYGNGTSVTLYGTDRQSHSVAMRALNFRPYLYVSLEKLDAATQDPVRRDALVERLVDDLQRQLTLTIALDKCKWSPERLAFRLAFAGRVRKQKMQSKRPRKRKRAASSSESASGDASEEDANLGKVRVSLEPGDACCAPIVGHEISHGLPARGSGPNSGYRGMRATRFLKIYFYSPSLITKARALLHGKLAEHGFAEQALRLARSRFHARTEEVAENAGEGRKGGVQTKWKQAAHDTGQRTLGSNGWCPDPMDAPETEEGIVNVGRTMRNALDELEVDEEPDVGDTLSDDDDDDSDATDDSEMEDPGGDSDDENDDRKSAVEECFLEEYQVGDQMLRYERRLDKRFVRRAKRAVEQNPPEMLAYGRTYDVFESDIDFVLRFAIDCGFAWEEWIEVDCERTLKRMPNGKSPTQPLVLKRIRGEKRQTRCQVEIEGDFRLIKRVADQTLQNTHPKHVLMSFDGEMEPGPFNEFPVPEKDRLLQVVFIIETGSVEDAKNKFSFRSVNFTLGSVDCRAEPREHCTERHLLCFKDEALMFEAIAKFVSEVDPHIVTGYNTDGFDIPYMVERAKALGVGDAFERAWGRSRFSSRVRVRERKFETKGAGTLVFTDVTAEGVVFLDLLKKLQRDPLIKLRSYTLNAVSEHFIGEQKEDILYSMIRTYQQTAAGREKLRSYCEKDALLPLELFRHLLIMPGMLEMARINSCTMEVLLNRGQQVRSKCSLYRKGALETIPRRFYTRTEEERRIEAHDTFKGAVVIDPKPGLYVDPVITVDWSSLYPSITVTHNLCMTTRVMPDYDLTLDPDIMGCEDPVNELTLEERQRRAEAAVWRVPDMTCKAPYAESVNADSAVFLRHPVLLGIVPKVQTEYLNHRNRVKRDMKQAYIDGDTNLAALLDQRQLAIKMLANSLYGMLGATSSFAYTPVVSSTVTLRGRCLLYLMAWLAKHHFSQYGAEVIYGDSVTGDTALILRVNGVVRTMRVDECAAPWQWYPYGDKEACDPINVQVWQDGGFTPVRRFIRHACHKPLKRILTHTGVVDCTTDHSLLREDGSACSPSDVRVGEPLLHAQDDELIETLNNSALGIAVPDAFALGLFAADGSSAAYDTRWGVKYTWAINNTDLAVLREAQAVLPFPTKILDTMQSSGVYKLVPCKNLKDPTLSYRAAFYNEHREKRIPPFILSAPIAVVREFWRGFYAGDGDRGLSAKQPGSARVDQRGKEVTAGLWLLARRMGYNVSINDRTDKLNVFRLTLSSVTDSEQRKPANNIKKVRDLPALADGEYVYDLETESHHFHVAPGNLVVHNTDSIFVRLGKVADLNEAARIGVEMSKFITAEMRRRFTTDSPEHNILSLEFEKVFLKLLLLAKKRYAGLKYEYDVKSGKLTPKPADGVPISSGLEEKRRDTTLLISQNVTDVLALLLDYRHSLDENLARARAFVWERMVRPLLTNTVNMRMLIVTKQLRMLPAQYSATKGGDAALPIHVQLAQKLIDRAGGETAQNAPRAGARLPYVVIEGAKHSKVSEQAEDPVYALENRLKVDSRYYLDRHVKPVLLRFLVPILCNQKQRQTVLSLSDAPDGADRQAGRTEAARQRNNDAVAAEFLFGHVTEYRDPISAADREKYAGVRPMAKENEPAQKSYPRYVRQQIKADAFQTAKDKGATRQLTLAAFVRKGARCKRCKTFIVGAIAGFMCQACTHEEGSGTDSVAEMRRYLLDIEELASERRLLADTCHNCMGCRDAPRTITCENTDCAVLWDRKQNRASVDELERRMAATADVLKATSELEDIKLYD